MPSCSRKKLAGLISRLSKRPFSGTDCPTPTTWIPTPSSASSKEEELAALVERVAFPSGIAEQRTREDLVSTAKEEEDPFYIEGEEEEEKAEIELVPE